MTVRIDAPLWPAHGTLWAHLVSDESLAELHTFAQRVGLPRRAFDLDHYDVPAGQVDDLVRSGAVPTGRRDLLRTLSASGLRVAGRDRAAARRAELLNRWEALLPGAAGVGVDLLDRWYEPHRRYHDAAHLTHVLDSLDVLVDGGPVPRAAALALWFHDAVYDGAAGADERASAALVLDGLTPVVGQAGSAGPDKTLPALPALSAAEVAEVVRLVLLTASHDPAPEDTLGALVCDADLAVLAGTPTQYASYVEKVRAEYQQVPDEIFYPARNGVLTRMLDGGPLFRTRAGRARWEEQAQANVRAEIAANVRRPTAAGQTA